MKEVGNIPDNKVKLESLSLLVDVNIFVFTFNQTLMEICYEICIIYKLSPTGDRDNRLK